jgi:hypothetical protein
MEEYINALEQNLDKIIVRAHALVNQINWQIVPNEVKNIYAKQTTIQSQLAILEVLIILYIKH